jgi:hypothetical protein
MTRVRALGLALAGAGCLAAAPAAAFADDDATLQDRIRELETQVQELRNQVGSRPAGDSLSTQVDRYLQEKEKGSLWVDRHGKPLQKIVDSIYPTMWMRVRPTWSDNYFDGDSDTDDEGFQTFWRARLGLGANLKDGVGMYMELDSNGTWGNTATMFVNDTPSTTTVQQAYVTGVMSKHLRMDTKLGRFEMEFGDEYVMGVTDFAQTSVYHDGVMLSRDYEKQGIKFDMWVTKLVDGYKNPLTPTPDDSAYMAGIYGNWYGGQAKTGMPGTFEPYYIFVWDAQEQPGVVATPNDPQDIHTAGLRWYHDKATKDKAGIGWNLNGNVQYQDEVKWSTDSRVTYTMPTMKYKPKIFGQFAYASGDHDDPGYNSLFQDGHARFGWADAFSFTNIMIFGAGVHVSPRESWTVGGEGRWFDQARETTALPQKRLAYELDFLVQHQYSEHVSVEFVYSFVNFRDVDTATGPADNVQRAYVQVVVSF